jgi:hypothetical protein
MLIDNARVRGMKTVKNTCTIRMRSEALALDMSCGEIWRRSGSRFETPSLDASARVDIEGRQTHMSQAALQPVSRVVDCLIGGLNQLKPRWHRPGGG